MKKQDANRYCIFISSVQKELAAERHALKEFILHDPLLSRYISDVFLFEDISARDRKPDDIYLDEVEGCDIFLAILETNTDGRTRRESRQLSWNLSTPPRPIGNVLSLLRAMMTVSVPLRWPIWCERQVVRSPGAAFRIHTL